MFISTAATTQVGGAPAEERLEAVLGQGTVFHDVVSIAPGVDFRPELAEGIDRADVILVLIGPRWLDELKKRQGGPEQDQVVVEIELALGSGKSVVPCWSTMPTCRLRVSSRR